MCLLSFRKRIIIGFSPCLPHRQKTLRSSSRRRSPTANLKPFWNTLGRPWAPLADTFVWVTLSGSVQLLFAIHDLALNLFDIVLWLQEAYLYLAVSPLSHWQVPENCFVNGQMRLAGTFGSTLQWEESRRSWLLAILVFFLGAPDLGMQWWSGMLVGKHFFLGCGRFNISTPHISTTLSYSLNISRLFYFHEKIFPKSTISVLSGADLISSPPKAFPDLISHPPWTPMIFGPHPRGFVSCACFLTRLLAFRRRTLFLSPAEGPQCWYTVCGPRRSVTCAWTGVREIGDFLRRVIDAVSIPSISGDWFGFSGVVSGPCKIQSGENFG